MSDYVDLEDQKTPQLVSGYIRNEYQPLLPSELIELIIVFYDLVFHWKFKGNSLKNLKSSINTEIVADKTIQIDGMSFLYNLYIYDEDNGEDTETYFLVTHEYLPDDVEYIGIYAQFFCIQSEYKSIAAGKLEANKDSGVSGKVPYNLLDFEKDGEICIDCVLEIKYIKYKKSTNKSDYNTLTAIDSISSIYTWNVSGDLLKKLQNVNIMTADIESPKFNDNQWSVSLSRYESLHNNQDVLSHELQSYVTPVLLPIGIFGMRFILNMRHKNTGDEFLKLYVNNRPDGIVIAGTRLYVKDTMDEQVLNIDLQIEIVACLDRNGDEISRSDWVKYGIVE